MNKRIENLVNSLKDCGFIVRVEYSEEDKEYYITFTDIDGCDKNIILNEDGKDFSIDEH